MSFAPIRRLPAGPREPVTGARACAAGSRGGIALAALVVVLAVVAGSVASDDRSSGRHPALRALPAHMAWAWEREEDLRWLPRDAGVAYVATSLWLEGDKVVAHPRANGLLLRPGTVAVPVVHVDASRQSPPAMTDMQRDAVVAALQHAAADAPARVVQLDFEARLSQRAFLADVVRRARRSLPSDVALSMTALASWCAGDGWMRDLAADEIVPMAFRMSRDSERMRAWLAGRGGFASARCRDAIGTATDEPLPGLTAPRRYVFSARPWTTEAWRTHPF